MQPEPRFFTAPDGVRLAWHEAGPSDGSAPRTVVLLHGLFSSAWMNWIKFGHAAAIATRGFRVIMPDLRAHGDSDKPHNVEAYPPDVLARDAEALIGHLGLTDFDLGGYSLGARTAARMMIGGVRPRRAVVAGMGLQGLLDTGTRAAHFRHILDGLGSWPRNSPEWMVEAFLKTTHGDAEAMKALLGSFVDSTRQEIVTISGEALVLQGSEDEDNGSGEALAELLPCATYREVPGGHMSCVVKPNLGIAIAEFLGH